MTQEDKELLLKDLCARLPHEVCVHIRYKGGEPCYGKLTPRDIQWFIDSNIEVIKPYLRPMSSMTKEEEKTYSLFSFAKFNDKAFDWLNAHHFDYRYLIGKGLALEALEGMYNIKEK